MILYIFLLCISSALAADMFIDTDAPYCYGRPFNIRCHCSQNSIGQSQLFNGYKPITDNLKVLNSTTTVYTVFPSLDSYTLSCGGCPDDSKSGTFTFSPSICPDVHVPIISSSAVTCSGQNFIINISTVSTDMLSQNVTVLISGEEQKEYVLKFLQHNSTYEISVEIRHTSNPQLYNISTFSETTKGCHYEYIGIPCSLYFFGMIIEIIIGIGIGVYLLIKKCKHSNSQKLPFGVPTQVEGGANDEQTDHEPNNNGDFIHAMESILRDARNGVPMDQSLKQELLTTLLRHRTANAGISYDQISEEEETPCVPVDSETIVDLDKTEVVISPCDNTVIRRNLSVRSDIGRSGETESHVVITNIPEDITPKSFTDTSGGHKSIGINDDD